MNVSPRKLWEMEVVVTWHRMEEKSLSRYGTGNLMKHWSGENSGVEIALKKAKISNYPAHL